MTKNSYTYKQIRLERLKDQIDNILKHTSYNNWYVIEQMS